jgi:hypothetical protein
MAALALDKTIMNVSKGTPPPVASRFRLFSGKVTYAEFLDNFLSYVVNGSAGSSKPILLAALEHPLQIILAFDSKACVVLDHRDEVAAVISSYLASINQEDKIDGALEGFAARHDSLEASGKGKGKKGASSSGAGGGGGGGAGDPSAEEVAGALGALGLSEDKIAAAVKSLQSSVGSPRSDVFANMTSFSLGGSHVDSPVLNARGIALVEDARVHDATVASLLRHYLADVAKHADSNLKGKMDESLQFIRDIQPADQAKNATALEKSLGFYASCRLSLQIVKESLQKGTTDAAQALDAKKAFQELRCTESSVQGWGTVFDQKLDALGQATAQTFPAEEVVEIYVKSFERSKEKWAPEVGRQIRFQMSNLKTTALATKSEPPVFQLETVKLIAIEYEATSKATKVGAEGARDKDRSGSKNHHAKGQGELDQAAFVAKAEATNTGKKAKNKNGSGELSCYICGEKHRFTEHSSEEIQAWKTKGKPKFGSDDAPSSAKGKPPVPKSKNGGKPSVVSGGAAEYAVCDGDSAEVTAAKIQLELVEREAEVSKVRARLALAEAQAAAGKN